MQFECKSTREIFSKNCNFGFPASISSVRQKRVMRIAVSLPEAHRETRGRAWLLRACAEN